MQDHPNIVKMYEMFEDGSHYYMVTEYLEAKDALELLHANRSISEELACNIFYQLILAVNYLHRNKCMHRYPPPHAGTSNSKTWSTTRSSTRSNS